jgi:hypothetical protein
MLAFDQHGGLLMARKIPKQPAALTALHVFDGLIENLPDLATVTPDQARQYARLIKAATDELRRTAPKPIRSIETIL